MRRGLVNIRRSIKKKVNAVIWPLQLYSPSLNEKKREKKF